MSKLYKLKKWVSIDAAAKRLSLSFGEEVSKFDILQLALEEHLCLSVRIINIPALTEVKHLVKKLRSEIEYKTVKNSFIPNETLEIPVDGQLINLPKLCKENETFQLEKTKKNYFNEHDIFDLPLCDCNYHLLSTYIEALNTPSKLHSGNIQKLIIRAESGNLLYIENIFDWKFNDIEIVARTAHLQDFENSLDETLTTKRKKKDDLDPREYNSLYSIVLAVAKFHYKYDPTKTLSKERQDAATKIAALTERYGYKLGYSAVNKHLKAASERLDK